MVLSFSVFCIIFTVSKVSRETTYLLDAIYTSLSFYETERPLVSKYLVKIVGEKRDKMIFLLNSNIVFIRIIIRAS